MVDAGMGEPVIEDAGLRHVLEAAVGDADILRNFAVAVGVDSAAVEGKGIDGEIIGLCPGKDKQLGSHVGGVDHSITVLAQVREISFGIDGAGNVVSTFGKVNGSAGPGLVNAALNGGGIVGTVIDGCAAIELNIQAIGGLGMGDVYGTCLANTPVTKKQNEHKYFFI